MKKNAQSDKSVTLNKHVITRLDQWGLALEEPNYGRAIASRRYCWSASNRNFIMCYVASGVSDAVSDHSISFFFSSSFEGR